jgi:hypothetical protein
MLKTKATLKSGFCFLKNAYRINHLKANIKHRLLVQIDQDEKQLMSALPICPQCSSELIYE